MIVDITDILNNSLDINFSGINKSRGTKRTDFLHKTIMDLYLKCKDDPDLTVEFGKKCNIQCFYGNNFKCDAVVFRNGIIESVFLFKSPISSILKNLFNSLNTISGEINRITGSENYINKNFNIVFLDIIPKKTLVFNGKLYKCEDVYKRYTEVNCIKKHPVVSKIPKLYVEKFWYDVNSNFIESLIGNKTLGKCYSYGDYIEPITIDFSKLP